jgi:hypothetical protein
VQGAIAEVDNEKVAKAGDTMTGTLVVPAGTAAAPALQGTGGGSNTGFYFSGSSVNISIAGSNRYLLSTTATINAPIRGADGTQAAPEFSFLAENGSGFYRKAAGSISISVTNSEVMNWNVTSKVTTAYGPIVLPADPTTALQAATKQYVDNLAASASGGATISDTPPSSPTQGQLWWESDSGLLCLSYNDGNSTQWIAVGGGGTIPTNSPIFTGDPQAPTPATADNDNSIATTAFVKAQNYASLASPVFTGDPRAPTPTAGDNDNSIATTAFVMAAIATTPPQGRLTLLSGTPVMTASTAGQTSIFYTAYIGNQIPLFDGSIMAMAVFPQLSVGPISDTSQNPSPIGASKCNDWFVWRRGGGLALSHGPDWTNDTTRSAGTALVRVNGIWLNNVTIGDGAVTGPAAQRGTYVGTTRSNASSQLDWIFGGKADGGIAGNFGVWNTYNRRPVASMSLDTTGSYALAAGGGWRPPNGSVNMRTNFVIGLQEDAAMAEHTLSGSLASSDLSAGIGFDSTTANTGTASYAYNSGAYGAHNVNARAGVMPSPGYHYLTALEFVITATTTIYGAAGQPSIQSGLVTRLEM